MIDMEALRAVIAKMEREHAEEILKAIQKALANVATNDTSQERVDKTSESVHKPWSPVSIGVDITEKGAHVIGIYGMTDDTSQIFYAKYYPVPQRTWVDLTNKEVDTIRANAQTTEWAILMAQSTLKEKNT